ncbi:TlpA family protein disulfide reductase [Peterkaempfera griseoplana]|uniref:TlpA family protein disulfide reductase n=1 Tax=Peterkaempfera griseoplana TaxID=66896 RepID=UPI0006E1346D|nr:thioredoxin family protein [Peterkaempfera griseoplana]
MTGLVTCAAVLVLATAFGLVKMVRDGRLRRRPGGEADRLTSADLTADLGERATLVQFSTTFCQPCRATRRVLSEVADTVPGVVHVEIDAETRLELVRRLEILRTPTVLVLDPVGKVVRRASGQPPRRTEVIAAIDEAAAGRG